MARIKGARRRCKKCHKLIFECNCNESIVREIRNKGLLED